MQSTGGVIWNSLPLMVTIDSITVAAALFLAWALLRRRAEVRAFGLMRPLVLLLSGTFAIALFHCVDLFTMLVLPRLVGHERAMSAMTLLHLEWSWLLTLVVVCTFSIGLAELLGRVLPELVRSIRDTQAARADLTSANAALEQTVAERTRALEDDVRRRIATEEALRNSETRYRGLFEASPIALREEDWSTVKGKVEEWLGPASDGRAVRDFFERHPERLLDARALVRVLDANRRMVVLYGMDSRTAFLSEVHRRARTGATDSFLSRLETFITGGERAVSEIEEVRPDGSRFIARATAELPLSHREDWSRVLVSLEDVTEFRELSSKLSYQASHDVLTGLVNRREFEQRLERVLASARESGAEHALCYLDLDQFKVVNDTCGHVAGDELLRQLSGVLARLLRRRDTLARLGGDEFAILVEHCSLDDARRVADAVLDALREFRFHWEERMLRVGVSIGLVPINADSGDRASVMSAADSACYAAKDKGRNRLHVYDDSDVVLLERRAEIGWVSRLGEALEGDRFRLYFQPIVPTTGPRSAGLHHELLLRLAEPDGTMVSPGQFLPAAERYGVSARIDRWVIRAALGWYAARPRVLDALEVCAINLSGQSLGDESLLEFVLDALGDFSFPGRKLCFEITETAAVGDFASASRFIDALKGHDVRFALDDFGSGLSSFGYLKSLPVDYLKIDGLFVKDIVEDPVDRAMVRSINEIGHVMGKQTIAEFVENAEVRAVLAEMGVDMVQGFGIGHPAPMCALETLRSTG